MLGNCYLPELFGVRILEFLSNCHLIGYDRVSIAGYPCPACQKRGCTAARRSPGPGRRGARREAPGSGSGPAGRRQRARRIGPVWQPSVAVAAADDAGFEIDDGMGAL